MTIPEKLKIGAKVYGVEITNKLDLGNVNYSGEISYTDKCYDCACNASYDECNHGYCITCFECLNESKAVHNIYLCTGYERMVANGNENSE